MASDKSDMERKIREAAAAGNIVFASSEKIDEYAEQAYDFISEIFGVEAFMISDDSTLGDFAMCCLPDGVEPPEDYHEAVKLADDAMIDRIFDCYGIQVTGNETILSVIQMIELKGKATLQ